MTIEFRPFTPVDAQNVREHFATCWRETYEPLIGQENTTKLLSGLKRKDIGGVYSGGDQVFFVAVNERQVIGTCVGACRHGVAYIWGCYVQLKFQRRRIGTHLMRSVIGEMSGVEEIELTVLDSSLCARRFYASMGFIEGKGVKSRFSGGAVSPANVFHASLSTLKTSWAGLEEKWKTQ